MKYIAGGTQPEVSTTRENTTESMLRLGNTEEKMHGWGNTDGRTRGWENTPKAAPK